MHKVSIGRLSRTAPSNKLSSATVSKNGLKKSTLLSAKMDAQSAILSLISSIYRPFIGVAKYTFISHAF
ncbi:MAG: hypothetical protein L0I51_02465 [Lactococcus plantarum]|nr:hypothetical protein [Lactococcus plantarum]